MNSSIIKKVIEEMNDLPDDLQQQVLGDFQKTKYPCRMGKAKRAHLKSLGEMGTLGFAHPTANL